MPDFLTVNESSIEITLIGMTPAELLVDFIRKANGLGLSLEELGESSIVRLDGEVHPQSRYITGFKIVVDDQLDADKL